MSYVSVLLFFVMDYVRPTSHVPALTPLRLNLLVLCLVTFSGFFGRSKVSNEDVLRETNSRLILFLLGLIGVSIVTADSSLRAFHVLEMVAGYALVYWAIARQVTSLRRIAGVFKTLVFVHVVIAILTPALFMSSDRQYISSSSFLGDPNDFALSVNVTIPMCLFLLLESRKVTQRLMYIALLLFLVFLVVMTQSRGGTIALVCVGIYYWLKSDKKIMTASLAAVAAALVISLAPSNYFDRLNTISTYEEDTSAMGRIAAWQAGARMGLTHPLLGVGAGHFPANFTTYTPRSEEFRWRTAHSIYFLALGELGLPGLGVLLALILSNILANRRLLAQARTAQHTASDTRLLACLSVSMAAYAIAGTFLSAVYYPHLYILAGLFVAARRIVQERATVRTASQAPVEPQLSYHWALKPVMRPEAQS
jgi:putative inorganic carbon (HCO3(-)) transporter